MLLTKPLLRCPGGVFGIIVMLKDPATFSSSMPLLMEGCFHSKSHDTWPHSFFPLHRSVVLVPLQKTAPKHDVSTPMLTVGMVFLDATQHSFSSKTRQVEFLPKVLFWFHLTIWHLPILFWIIQMLSSKLQTGLDMYWLKQGERLALQDLSPWWRSVLLMVAFVTLVPALCRSFTRSPRVVLGFLLTVLVSFWPHGVRSCVEPQIEGDYQWSCMSSIF